MWIDPTFGKRVERPIDTWEDIVAPIAPIITTIETDRTYVIRWYSTGVSWGIEVNRVAQTIAAAVGRTQFNLGLFSLDGKIGEFIVIEGANLSPTNRSKLYNYLSSKWGV